MESDLWTGLVLMTVDVFGAITFSSHYASVLHWRVTHIRPPARRDADERERRRNDDTQGTHTRRG